MQNCICWSCVQIFLDYESDVLMLFILFLDIFKITLSTDDRLDLDVTSGIRLDTI